MQEPGPSGAPESRGHPGPEFLVVGHVTRDRVADRVRPGGTASYAGAVAARLGLRTAVFTSAADDLELPPEMAGVALYRLPAEHTTTFEHFWHGRVRDQYVRTEAARLSAAAVPQPLREVPVVLIGPVIAEVSDDLPAAFSPAALRGATIQGWLRRLAADHHLETIDPAAWHSAPVLGSVDAAFLSEEDLQGGVGGCAAVVARWATEVRLLAVTRGDGGADIAVAGRWHSIGIFPAREVEATGAGDAFAAGFLIRYHETADVAEAARYAAAVASFVVEAYGIAAAPTRQQVEQRLAEHPEVRLRPR